MWHYATGEEAKECWDRRVKRFNFNNYFIKMTCQTDNETQEFSKLKLKNKIVFYYKDVGLDSILYMKEWNDVNLRKQYSFQFSTYVRNQVCGANCNAYNVLKILNGISDSLRKI